MAKKKQTVEIALTNAQAEALAGTARIDDTEEIDDADELRALQELEGAESTRWNITRKEPADKAGYVGTLTSTELTLERIAQLYGVGKYQVRGHRTNGQFAGQSTVVIACAPPAVPAAANAAPASAVQDVLAIIREERERGKDELFKWGSLLVPAITPILGRLFEGRKETTLAELTTALANMKQLAGADQSQVSKVEEFARMVEVVKGIIGEGKQATGRTWVDAIVEGVKEVGPAVAGLVAARGQQPIIVPAGAIPPGMPGWPRIQAPPAAPMQSAVPAPAAAPVPPAEKQEQDPMLALLQWFNAQLPMLVEKAKADRDPQLYADVLADNLPEGAKPADLKQWLGRADWWEMLANFHAPCAHYRGWFTEMRNRLLRLIEDSEREHAIDEQVRQSMEPISNE